MKGIIKYQQKFYKKSKKTRNVKEGDLIKLECKRGDDHFQYNGIYTVVDKYKHIEIKKVEQLTYVLKLGYNVMYDDFSILIPVERKKSLPTVLKEEQEYLEFNNYYKSVKTFIDKTKV